MSKLIYLASPYTHPDPDVQEQRYAEIAKAAAQFIKQGHCVYSPIAHWHKIAELAIAAGNPITHDEFLHVDEQFILCCSEVWVVKLPGWGDSKGVMREIHFAIEKDIEIRYFAYNHSIGEYNESL